MASLQEIRQQYPQYNDMSDDALANALHQKFYSDMPREQFNQKIGLQKMSGEDQALDIAKSGGTGLVKGTIGLAGQPADTLTQSKQIGGFLGNRLGLSPETQSKIGAGFDFAARSGLLGPFGALGSHTPGAQTIQSAVEERTGKFYEPKTTGGQYAQTVGEILPSAVIGPGGAARKIGGAIGAGLASEAAGQATAGSKYETAARIGGAIAGGLPFGRWRTSETRLRPALLGDELKASGNSAYEELRALDAQLKPGGVAQEMRDAADALKKSGLNSENVPDTFKALNKLTGLDSEKKVVDLVSGVRKEPTRVSVGVDEIDQARQELLAAAQNQTNKREATAAWRAIEALDRYLAKIPAGEVIKGDAGQIADLFSQARGDWAAYKRLQLLQGQIDLGEHGAATTHSGMNVENKLRQTVGALIKPRRGKQTLAEQHGFSDREIAAMKRLAYGSKTRDTIRYFSNLLGGGGGIGQSGLALGGAIAGAGLGYETGGHSVEGALLGGLAGLGGFGLRKLGGRLARQEAERAADIVGDRSPLGRSLGPPTRTNQNERAQLMAAGLLRANEPLRITVHPKKRDRKYGGPL